MFWLIAIWVFAAFCGWLVYSAYGPVLEIAGGLAYQMAPELIGPISAIGQAPGVRMLLAIGTALVIGIGLSLVWLVIRALTGGAKRAVGSASHRQPAPARPAPAQQRTDWQLDDRELDDREIALATPRPVPQAEAEPVRSRSERPRDPFEPPPDPFDPATSAPRWGRQAKTDRDR